MSWLRGETGLEDASGAAGRVAGCWLPRRRPCAPAAPSHSAAAALAAAAKTAPATELSLRAALCSAAPRKGRAGPLCAPRSAALGSCQLRHQREGRYLVLQLASRLQVLHGKHVGCHVHIWGHLQERALWGDSREAGEQLLQVLHHLSAAQKKREAETPAHLPLGPTAHWPNCWGRG